MKKFALLAMGAVTFLSTFDSSEAQILQRFRSNIRQAISPLVGPPLQVQPFNGPSPEVRLQPGCRINLGTCNLRFEYNVLLLSLMLQARSDSRLILD